MRRRPALIIAGFLAGGLAALVFLMLGVVRRQTADEQRNEGIPAHPHRHFRFHERGHLMTNSHVLLDQDSEPRGALSLGGTVVGDDGRGVETARVMLDSIPPRTTVTDKAGQFLFEGLLPRSYVVRAISKDSWGMTAVRLSQADMDVAVHIQPGVTVIARVVDAADGKPIAGATVSIGDISATTSDEGEATLRPVRPGWTDIESSAESYAGGRTTSIVSEAPINRVEIRLSVGASIVGHVVDERGDPLSFASIFVVDDASVPAAGSGPAALSDETGRFLIADVSPGVRRLFAIDAEHAPTTSRPLVVEAERLDVVLTLRRGVTLEGRVVDNAGVPAPRATIRLDSFDQTYSRQTVSGLDGSFRLPGLGRMVFYVRAEAALGASETSVVDLLTSDVSAVELKLLPLGEIAGTVIDEKGNGCADVRVNAMLTVNTSVIASVMSDKHGRFSMGDLPEGRYALWSGRFNDLHVQGEDVQAMTGDTNVMLMQPTFGAVRGEIAVLDSGRPPEDAIVAISGMKVGVDQTFRVFDTGVFQFGSLPPDEYRLVIRGPQFVETSFDVTVAAGRVTDLGRNVLHGGRVVAGRVLDETGKPVSGARLHIGPERVGVDYDNLNEPWTRTTDADGRFTFGGLRATDTYLLVATHRQGCSRGILVPPNTGTNSHNLVLLPCGPVVGTVLNAGRPVAGALIAVGVPQIGAAMSDGNGAFAFARIPKGPTWIRVFKPGSLAPSYEGEIDVQAGKQTDLTLEMSEPAP